MKVSLKIDINDSYVMKALELAKSKGIAIEINNTSLVIDASNKKNNDTLKIIMQNADDYLLS